ncbi:MAG: hypothetical protein ACRDG5_00540 [Anaerolineales bacterium]
MTPTDDLGGMGSTSPRPRVTLGPPATPSVGGQGPISPWWIVLPLGFLGLVGVGILTGYWTGVRLAEASEAQLALQSAQEQFDLGVQDLLAGRYELARQRFEYILGLDPNYPGAAELLDKALQGLNVPTGTPTLPAPSPTPRPTLDLSSLEGVYQQAVAAHSVEDWTGTLEALLALRQIDPTFRLGEVNILMASALRNRGLVKIFAGDREQGIYDLALAERFGPLDGQAANWRSTAAFYSHANSYFGLDWAMATDLFSQACRAGVWDSCYKFAVSARKYGDLLMSTSDPCAASVQYALSIQTMPDAGVAPTATFAASLCLTATALPATGTPPATLTPTTGFDTAVPSETPTLSPTFTPTTSGTPTPEATSS